MNSLYIDSTDNKKVIVMLTIDNKKYQEEKEIVQNRGQIILPLIQQLLSDHNLSPKDLSRIEVNPGPGSFTGVRVGIAIANALGFSLGIPVNGVLFKENKKIVEPVY